MEATVAKRKTGDRPTADDAADDAAMEKAWRESGDLYLLAIEVGHCRCFNKPPPAWLHRALLELAWPAMRKTPYGEAMFRLAVSLARYTAVRDAHDCQGLSWEAAKDRAVEVLRDTPAAAGRDWMYTEYKNVRKLMRDAGTVRDAKDPGYRWIDASTNKPV